jgi:hypothetical protein
MTQEDWPNPAGVEGKYCCEGCASGSGCTCGETQQKQSKKENAKR